MASLSLEPAANIDSFPRSGPRHARKHSRHPTAAAQLPSFSFNPGSPSQDTDAGENGASTEIPSMVGSGHMRRPSKPTPLPDFSFNPGAHIPVVRTPSPTHPVLEEMAMNQHRHSKSARPAPLPHYVFNPSAPSGSTSPTKSEADPVGGHRRGGSEFVGGKADGAQLVAVSPAKPEPKSSGPPVSAHGPRGHKHVRSAAVSVSDIDTSELIKAHALAKARAPSNPSTPQESTFVLPRASPGEVHLPSTSRSPPASPRRRGSASAFRPRTVDFSERVDVIPRPLSMISSETERSSSTPRGHSVANSISSVASFPRPSPPATVPESDLPSIDTTSGRRPNTADASLLLSTSAAENEENLLTIPKRPLSASGSPMVSSSGSPPMKKKHFWSTAGTDPSPTPTPNVEQTDPFDDRGLGQNLYDAARTRPKTAPERPTIHKRRKYHTWTAGIFSKKGKHRASKKSRRTPTPPTLFRPDSDKVDDIFDADDTVVLRETSPASVRKQPVLAQPIPVAPQAARPAELLSPMIDLDAALETAEDDQRNSDDNAKKTTARIAKLHSSERRSVVDAFGVSHRRSESAPALSPVNRSALFGIRQQGSNASLSEEVFDEEEEDNFWAHEEEVRHNSTGAPVTNQISATLLPRENGLGLTNMTSQSDLVMIADPDQEVVDEDVRSSKSTLEAPIHLSDDLLKRPSTSPMPFAYPDPQFHYASSTEARTTSASLISSPDADHVSFDAQSRTRRLGELNADVVRPSTDDLPSLSDSASTNVFPRVNARPSLEYRSNSMFVPGSSRLNQGWKRASLASLNRLIPGSPHGSKLKLDTLSTEEDEKTRKKSNRISRLLRFWRSKGSEERPSTSLH